MRQDWRVWLPSVPIPHTTGQGCYMQLCEVLSFPADLWERSVKLSFGLVEGVQAKSMKLSLNLVILKWGGLFTPCDIEGNFSHQVKNLSCVWRNSVEYGHHY